MIFNDNKKKMFILASFNILDDNNDSMILHYKLSSNFEI